VIVLAACAGAFDASSQLFPVDFSIFGRAADTLLSADWADAFISEDVQVGPLHLLLMGAMRGIARSADLQYRLVFAVVTQAVVAAGVMGTVRVVLGRREIWVEGLTGLATVVGGLGWVAYISGHPEELLVGLLWTWAAVRARRGHAVEAGVAVGIAALLKLAGVLGLPVLFLLAARRDRFKAILVSAGMVVLGYAPFFVFGHVETFSYEWGVRSALLDALLPAGATFPWELRVLQAAVAVALGGLIVQRLGTRAGIVWLVPMSIVVGRTVLDPLPHYYLWMPFDALGLVAAAALTSSGSFRRQAVAFGAAYTLLLVRYLPTGAGVAIRVAALVLLVVLVARERGLDPAPAPGAGGGREEPVTRRRTPV
jgi:hypothetical protein